MDNSIIKSWYLTGFFVIDSHKFWDFEHWGHSYIAHAVHWWYFTVFMAGMFCNGHVKDMFLHAALSWSNYSIASIQELPA